MRGWCYTSLEYSEEDVPPLAIRPYPLQYVQPWTAKDGTPLVIRPIRPEDEPLIVKFHEKLSEQTVYRRYFEHSAPVGSDQARAADAHLLQRLRSGDRPGGRARRSCDGRARDRGRGAP